MSARIRGARVAAVVLGASLAVLGTAMPASAGTHDEGGVGATPPGVLTHLSHVWLDDGDHPLTGLIKLETDEPAHTLWTYCVEETVHLDDGEHMHSVGWDSYPDPSKPFAKHNDKVLWILRNSYPTVNPGTLADAAGVTKLTAKEAAAATQAAIWHYSDGVDLNENTTGAHANAPAVVALYDYLTGAANKGADGQPQPTLTLTPNGVSGHVGGLVGPVTVNTNADAITWTSHLPAGVEITDARGEKRDLHSVTDGSTIYFKVPEGADPATDGWIRGVTKTVMLPGQLFVNDHYGDDPSQSLILAEATKVTASAKATVTWTPAAAPTSGTTPTSAAPTTTSGALVPPSPGPGTPSATQAPVDNASEQGDLAYTGVAIGLPIGVAALLLLGGGAILLAQRRRKGDRT